MVVIRGADGCICLHCFARETGGELPMPQDLSRDLRAALAEIDAAAPSTPRGPAWP